jgi:tripartite-type tricarboxylate transporter receptor subunit TctC
MKRRILRLIDCPKRGTPGAVVLLLVFAVFLSPGMCLSAPYYEGRVLRIVVGYEAAGGYDRMARLFAKYLRKHLPGAPSVVVENMPGASSIVAANYLYSVAKPDGLTIGALDRGLPFAQLLKTEGVKFDILKYAWVGSAAEETAILAIRTSLPYKTFSDLQKAKEPIYLGTTSPAASGAQFAMILKEFLKVDLKTVIYPSSAAIALAIERKEVDARGGSFSSFKPAIDQGLVRAVIRGRVSEPEIENLPVDEDLTTEKTGKLIMAMRSGPDRVGRPFVAPPKTPAHVMAVLRDAFARVSRDPETLEEAKKIGMTVKYIPSEECLGTLKEVLNQPEDIVKEFSKYIKF